MAILIPVVVALLLALFTGVSGYGVGKKVERSIWQGKEIKLQAQITAAQEERDKLERQFQTSLAEITTKHEETNTKLSNDIADLGKRGLYISATRCPSGAESSAQKAGDTERISGSSGRVRLSSTDESNLIALAGDAQKVVDQYNVCRGVLSKLVVTN